jgi:hypothetical protein
MELEIEDKVHIVPGFNDFNFTLRAFVLCLRRDRVGMGSDPVGRGRCR